MAKRHMFGKNNKSVNKVYHMAMFSSFYLQCTLFPCLMKYLHTGFNLHVIDHAPVINQTNWQHNFHQCFNFQMPKEQTSYNCLPSPILHNNYQVCSKILTNTNNRLFGLNYAHSMKFTKCKILHCHFKSDRRGSSPDRKLFESWLDSVRVED